jgi:hypothetical protein
VQLNERRGKRTNKKVYTERHAKIDTQITLQHVKTSFKRADLLMPRVNLFFSQDEYKELEKKASKDHPSVYAYLKDIALTIIKSS